VTLFRDFSASDFFQNRILKTGGNEVLTKFRKTHGEHIKLKGITIEISEDDEILK
jgi:hypothetical protein